MKRKFIALISVLALTCSALSVFALGGCSDKPKLVDVSTAEEFAAVEADCIVNLKNDIDFNGNAVPGNKVVYGNGYKIHNGRFGGSFALGTKDLTIENLTCTGKNMRNFGIISGYAQAKYYTERLVVQHYYFDDVISNVHIKNCKLDFELEPAAEVVIGGLLGKTIMEGQYYHEDKSEIKIDNCSVEGLEINLKRPATSSFWDKNGTIVFGGIVGSGMHIKMSNTFVKDCKFTVTAGHPSENIRMGGLIGVMNRDTEISHCYVKDTTLEAINTAQTGQSVTGGRTTAYNRLGGLAAEASNNAKMTACYSEGNEIVSSSSGKSFVGGIASIAGYEISQCYAVDNDLVCKGRAKDDTNQSDIRVGGIAAATAINPNGGSNFPSYIKSSFAFNNRVSIELKDLNSKYYYWADKKPADCKDFFTRYLSIYKTDQAAAAQFLTDTLNRDDADKAAVQELIDALAKRFEEVGTDIDSVNYYLGTYYDNLISDYNKLDNIYIGGLLGTTVKNAKVQKCAADLQASSYHSDRFCRTVIEQADYDKSECYITNGVGVNNRGCTELAPEQTYGNALIEKLQLTDEKWTTSESGLPTLAI